MDSKKQNSSSFIFLHQFKEIHLHHHYSIPNISISSSTILLFPFFINISIKNTNLVIFSFIQSFWTIYFSSTYLIRQSKSFCIFHVTDYIRCFYHYNALFTFLHSSYLLYHPSITIFMKQKYFIMKNLIHRRHQRLTQAESELLKKIIEILNISPIPFTAIQRNYFPNRLVSTLENYYDKFFNPNKDHEYIDTYHSLFSIV